MNTPRLLCLYALLPLCFVALLLLSRAQTLPEEVSENGLQGILSRVAHYIYARLYLRHTGLRSSAVRQNLATLSPSVKEAQAEAAYYTQKICLLLAMLLAGSLLSAMLLLSEQRDGVLQNGGQIRRNDYGKESLHISLRAQTTEGEALGIYPLEISARQYTAEEANLLFTQASALLPGLILGDNLSLDAVRNRLNLLSEIDGYPFRIKWQIGNYGRIRSDGTLIQEELPEEGDVVTLTAEYGYEDMRWQQIIYARILPRKANAEEKLNLEINALLQSADTQSLQAPILVLPASFRNRTLRWKEVVRDNSIYLFLLSIASALLLYAFKDRELQKQILLRENQLLLSYPQFISELVLYLGAGMTVRSIVLKLSGDYMQHRARGEEKRYLYEELCRVGYELDSGIPEALAYEHFADRCRIPQYTRLCTLLTQNLKKGSAQLLPLLREESANAVRSRMDQARKLGEQAGTKLLAPMMLMLAVVMVLIMIPAYMSL